MVTPLSQSYSKLDPPTFNCKEKDRRDKKACDHLPERCMNFIWHLPAAQSLQEDAPTMSYSGIEPSSLSSGRGELGRSTSTVGGDFIIPAALMSTMSPYTNDTSGASSPNFSLLIILYYLVHTVFSYKLSDASPESYLPSSLFLFNRYCFTSLITTREGCLLTAFLSPSQLLLTTVTNDSI